MQQSRDFQGTTLSVVPAEQLGQPAGNRGNPLAMRHNGGIAELHCPQQHHQRIARHDWRGNARFVLLPSLVREHQQVSDDRRRIGRDCRHQPAIRRRRHVGLTDAVHKSSFGGFPSVPGTTAQITHRPDRDSQAGGPFLTGIESSNGPVPRH